MFHVPVMVFLDASLDNEEEQTLWTLEEGAEEGQENAEVSEQGMTRPGEKEKPGILEGPSGEQLDEGLLESKGERCSCSWRVLKPNQKHGMEKDHSCSWSAGMRRNASSSTGSQDPQREVQQRSLMLLMRRQSVLPLLISSIGRCLLSRRCRATQCWKHCPFSLPCVSSNSMTLVLVTSDLRFVWLHIWFGLLWICFLDFRFVPWFGFIMFGFWTIPRFWTLCV